MTTRWGDRYRGALAAALVIATSCAVPYQPASVPVPDTDRQAVETEVLAVFLQFFPRLVAVERGPLRLHSDWVLSSRAGDPTPQRARGSLRLVTAGGVDQVEVVVERQSLQTPELGLPRWVPTGGDPAFEQRVVDAIEARFKTTTGSQ
jgi:hypothetical protein